MNLKKVLITSALATTLTIGSFSPKINLSVQAPQKAIATSSSNVIVGDNYPYSQYYFSSIPDNLAIQNFYIEYDNTNTPKYMYTTQRKQANTSTKEKQATILCRFNWKNGKFNYLDKMILKDFGHGQTLEMYTWNGKSYFLIGCKSEGDNNWSTQIARIQYKPGVTLETYTSQKRFTCMNYVGKDKKQGSIGKVKRVAAAVSSNEKKVIFRVQTNTDAVRYATYNFNQLNSLLDKTNNNQVRMDTSDAHAACTNVINKTLGDYERSGNSKSFQGIELENNGSFYISSGQSPSHNTSKPVITKVGSNGNIIKIEGFYQKADEKKNASKTYYEIEGMQLHKNRIYYVLVEYKKNSSGKYVKIEKNAQRIYVY